MCVGIVLWTTLFGHVLFLLISITVVSYGMTLWQENSFCITGPLCRDSLVIGGFPSQTDRMGSLDVSLLLAWTNCWKNNWSALDLRSCVVTVVNHNMCLKSWIIILFEQDLDRLFKCTTFWTKKSGPQFSIQIFVKSYERHDLKVLNLQDWVLKCSCCFEMWQGP